MNELMIKARLKECGIEKPLPEGFEVIEDYNNRMLTIKRPDGLMVFLSKKDPIWLNKARIELEDPKEIITLVGIVRGLQIINGYNKHYLKDKGLMNITNETLKRAPKEVLEIWGNAHKPLENYSSQGSGEEVEV